MAQADFVQQLRALGLDVHEEPDARLWFLFTVPVGRFVGQEIRIGFTPLPDFPATPPSGPHVSPRLLPLNPQSGPHPSFGVHESPPFGQEWEYWSRPMNHWPQSQRNAREVMSHIHRLFDTQ